MRARAITIGAMLCVPTPTLGFALIVGGGVPATSSGIALGQRSPFANDPNVSTEEFANAAGCGTSKFSVTGSYTIGTRTTLNRRQLPKDDASCFFALGTTALKASATLSIAVPTGKRIDYIGFYWGSIDPYNFLSFANGSGNAISLGSYGAEISGSDVVAAVGGPPMFASSFVAFQFSIGEVVRSLTLRQTNFAFEIDNLSYRLVDVFPAASASPARVALAEPVAVQIATAGVMAIVARRRTRGGSTTPKRTQSR